MLRIQGEKGENVVCCVVFRRNVCVFCVAFAGAEEQSGEINVGSFVQCLRQ